MSNEELGFWTLPKPDMFVKNWRRLPRVARTVPFGYEVDEEDEDFLVPVSIQLDALDKAKQHLRQYSYREVANWLTKETGRYISHTGLRKRIEVDKKRKRTITIKRKFAQRLEKAISEIQKLEEESLDCFTTERTTRA
jgi:hypothetical protein|tara:strand:+ start:5831 stop:6244 length:414 start_codon:yes stop_codon:yes gene_type:complete